MEDAAPVAVRLSSIMEISGMTLFLIGLGLTVFGALVALIPYRIKVRREWRLARRHML